MEHTTRTVISHTNHAPSIQSTPRSDLASEDADEYYPEGAASKASRSKRANKPGSGSNRPSSPPRSSYSRRGSTRRGFGGPGLSMANSSRIESLDNRSSMTHAPSLTSHAFFRPMSSQRLQAQRAARPNTGTQESFRLSSASVDRPSMESNNTATPTSPGRREQTARPSSRGTDLTEGDLRDRAISDAGRPRNDTLETTAESMRPLQGTRRVSLDDESDKNAPLQAARSGFSRQTKNSPAPMASQFKDHERDSNDTNSPHLQEKDRPKPSAMGKNYEYFSGNTVFCWGGRLQNTRDRPINIASAIMLIVPMILFFIFEYVA